MSATFGELTGRLTIEIGGQKVELGNIRVPVTPVPSAEWEAWKSATRNLDYTPDCDLIDAVDSLAREVAR